MGFIKDENEKESSVWDWVILAAIVIIGLGFWWYYSGTKNNTMHGFEAADSLFVHGEYRQAYDMYKQLQAADYLEPAHDSVLFERLDTLYTILGIQPE